MKKPLLICVALLLCLAIWIAQAYTAFFSKTYNLSEPGITLTVPPKAYVFTRKQDQGVPFNIDWYGIFKNTSQEELFRKTDIYLSARYADYEIQISGFEDFGTKLLFDFARLAPGELSGVKAAFAEMYDGEDVSMYNNGTHYILVNYNQHKQATESGFYNQAYITVRNGKLITVALIAPQHSNGAEGRVTLKALVDSMQYYNPK